MKQSRNIVSLFLLIFCLFGCQNKKTVIRELDFNAQECVLLSDYHFIRISSEELQVSEQDIDAVISMELATKAELQEVTDRKKIEANDITVLSFHIRTAQETKTIPEFYYEVGSELFGQAFDKQLLLHNTGDIFSLSMTVPSLLSVKSISGKHAQWEIKVEQLFQKENELTPEIAKKIYGVETVREAREKIKESIIAGRTFDIAYQRILSSSKVLKMPSVYANFAAMTKDSASSEASENIEENVNDFFTEYTVLKAITEQEGISYSIESWDQALNRLVQETSLSEEEILDSYGTYGVCYEMMYEDVKKLLPQYVTIVSTTESKEESICNNKEYIASD